MDWTQVAAARIRARLLLLIGGTAPLLVIGLFVAPGQIMGGCFGCDSPRIADIPTDLVMPLIGIAGAVFGFAWMWRIYRAPTRFLEARWRYRDR